MILTGENRRIWRETYFSATLSATDLMLTVLSVNLGHFGEKPVTNDLSYGTAIGACTEIFLLTSLVVMLKHFYTFFIKNTVCD
jgi:hypothetical protein